MLTIVAQFVIILSVHYNQELLKRTLKEYLDFFTRNFSKPNPNSSKFANEQSL